MPKAPHTRGRIHFKRTELPLDDYPLVDDGTGGLVPDIPEGTPTDRKWIEYEGYPDLERPTLWVRCEVEVVDGRLYMHDFKKGMTDNTASETALRDVTADMIEGALRRFVAVNPVWISGKTYPADYATRPTPKPGEHDEYAWPHPDAWYTNDAPALSLTDWLPLRTKRRDVTGRKKRSRLDAAMFAAEWDALIEAKDPRPRVTLGARHNVTPSTISNWRQHSIDCGFLDKSPGSGIMGGRMTDDCRRFLVAHGIDPNESPPSRTREDRQRDRP